MTFFRYPAQKFRILRCCHAAGNYSAIATTAVRSPVRARSARGRHFQTPKSSSRTRALTRRSKLKTAAKCAYASPEIDPVNYRISVTVAGFSKEVIEHVKVGYGANTTSTSA